MTNLDLETSGPEDEIDESIPDSVYDEVTGGRGADDAN